MEPGTFDVESGHLGVGDNDAAGVLASVELAAHSQAGFGGSSRDQLDDDAIADEWLGAPVLTDEREEPVLDFVPLAGAGRQMADHDVDALASFCSSRFHSRTRDPLLPPPSAVMSRRLAWG